MDYFFENLIQLTDCINSSSNGVKKIHYSLIPTWRLFHSSCQMSSFSNIANKITLPEILGLKIFSTQKYTLNFSCLNAYFMMSRNCKYYIIHCFIPSMLCVIISWCSFWIKLDIAGTNVLFPSDVTVSLTFICF